VDINTANIRFEGGIIQNYPFPPTNLISASSHSHSMKEGEN
jgi:hypothetical protein